jgi:transposase-like protein
MSIDNFHCPSCNQRIDGWIVRRSEFDCPACGAAYESNYKVSLRRAIWAGLSGWLLGLLLAWFVTGVWQKALVVALELGVLGALALAVLVHRLSVKITAVE